MDKIIHLIDFDSDSGGVLMIKQVFASTFMSLLLFFDMLVPAFGSISFQQEVKRSEKVGQELFESLDVSNLDQSASKYVWYMEALGVEEGWNLLSDHFDQVDEEPKPAIIALLGPGVDKDHDTLQGRLLPGKNFIADRDDNDLADE